MPLGHLGVNVTDLTAAREYYDKLMPLLAYERLMVDDNQFAYRPSGGKIGTLLFFYPASEAGYSRVGVGLQHLAFMVPTRADVDNVHKHVRAQGDEIIYAPQEFTQYPTASHSPSA